MIRKSLTKFDDKILEELITKSKMRILIFKKSKTQDNF